MAAPEKRNDNPTVTPSPGLLESDVPLSHSVIWRFQRQFYEDRGLRAWTEDLVPQYITNNPFIAEIYARIVTGFVCDSLDNQSGDARPLSPQNPLRILEQGAGSGKFAFLFLRHLAGMLGDRGIALETVRYCMTDCSESLLQTWRGNHSLAEFVERGSLKFELLPAAEASRSQFLAGQNGATSQPGSAPLVVIANYVLDSLPQDAFVIQDGKLCEALVTTRVPTAEPDAGNNVLPTLSKLQLAYKNVVVGGQRYPYQEWNEILELYRARLPGATVFFPTAALTALRELSRLNGGRMLVLAADKGLAHESQLLHCQGPPTIEFHGANCFSQLVNFDAIGKYFKTIGGHALLPEKHTASLNICAFLQGLPGDLFASTRAAYEHAQGGFGADDLFALLAWLDPEMEKMTVLPILALLRLSRWDPIVLSRLFPVLSRQLRTVSAERDDLRRAVMNTWANHFPVLPGDNALAFQCGVILLELHFYEDAAGMFKASQTLLGPSAATSYNLGLCEMGLGRSAEALDYMVEACNQDLKFEPAQRSRLKLEGGKPQN